MIKSDKYLIPYYLIAFLGEIYFIVPVWLFFYLRVVNYEQLTYLIAIQAIAAVLFEIPTGAFADIFGKKLTLIISFMVYSITLFLYTLNSYFGFFIVLEILKGFAKSMYSGSFEAMVYDTLIENKQEVKYDHIISNFTSLAWIALFISSYLGGFLFKLNPNFPYLITAFVYLIVTLIFIFYTKEPKVDTEKYNISLKKYLLQNLKGFNELFLNINMSIISIFIIIISFSYQMTSEFLGLPQVQAYGLKPEYVGILFGTAYIISAGLSQIYKKLSKYFSSEILIGFYILIALISLIFANKVGLYLGSFLILSRISFSTIYLNSKSVLINKNINSKNRATALSTLNLIVLIPFTLVMLTSGKFIEQTSPNVFAQYFGYCILTLLITLGLVKILILKTVRNKKAN